MGKSDIFIKKARNFRIHFGLSERDVDYLLKDKGVGYSRLESGKRTLTLELAEAYPLIYGIEYCDFKKEDTEIPAFEDLPQITQDYINLRPLDNQSKVGAKGSKNIASYVIHEIKDYPVGERFLNFEILKKLPSLSNSETTIDWNNGLLKGLVRSTKKFKEYQDDRGETKRGMIYTLIKAVTPELLEKALKNIEKG